MFHDAKLRVTTNVSLKPAKSCSWLMADPVLRIAHMSIQHVHVTVKPPVFPCSLAGTLPRGTYKLGGSSYFKGQ